MPSDAAHTARIGAPSPNRACCSLGGLSPSTDVHLSPNLSTPMFFLPTFLLAVQAPKEARMPYIMLQGLRKKAKERAEHREAMEAAAGVVTGNAGSARRKSAQTPRRGGGGGGGGRGGGGGARSGSDRGSSRCASRRLVWVNLHCRMSRNFARSQAPTLFLCVYVFCFSWFTSLHSCVDTLRRFGSHQTLLRSRSPPRRFGCASFSALPCLFPVVSLRKPCFFRAPKYAHEIPLVAALGLLLPWAC